jgi:hypothetical protein
MAVDRPLDQGEKAITDAARATEPELQVHTPSESGAQEIVQNSMRRKRESGQLND